MEQKGIKETSEVIEAALIIGTEVLHAMSDGKLSFGEALDVVKTLLDKGNREKFALAAQNIKEVPAELADISLDEVKAIVAKVLAAKKG